MKKPLSATKTWLLTGLILVLAICVYEFMLPGLVLQMATLNLRHVRDQQTATFTPAIEALSVTNAQAHIECAPSAQTHWQTTSSCIASQSYDQSASLPSSARARILKNAQSLDALLARNGWTIDRPQDPITTIAGSIPTKPLPALTFEQVVPYHKNIGDISCNLVIQFSGPTDGVAPGIVSVSNFSCQQGVSFVMPHIFTHAADPAYGA